EVLILESNTADFISSNFNDQVSSIKVYEYVAPPLPSVTTLFGNGNYTGTSWALGVGDYPDVTLEGITDNDVSSIEIEAGYVVELYSEQDYGGEVLILESNIAYLTNSNFNDQVSSIKVYKEPAILTLFEYDNFEGTSWELNLGEYADISNEGIPVNAINSLKLMDDYVVELYPDLNFAGVPLVLKSDTSYFIDMSYSNNVESVKVFKDQCKCVSGEYSIIINGSFEETSNTAYASAFDMIEDLGTAYNDAKFIDAHPDTDIPGWFTTGGIPLQQGGFSQGGTMELGQSGFLGRQAPDGEVFIEMDGNHHNQIISVTSGQLLDWELSHRGRAGTDEITISAGPEGNQTVVAIVSSPNTAWTNHTGQYEVPDGINEIQFTITPSGAGDGDIDSSNLLDFVKLCPISEFVTNGAQTSLAKTDNVQEVILTMYSNPVDDKFYLHSEKPLTKIEDLYIYSATGMLVKHQQVIFENSNKIKVYVDELSSGLYTVLIVDNDTYEINTFKMIKN
uniref:beta/gamma crystallin-related protein n=1 Tax=Algibacter mikhailovii TaxID=425498 RepID=UPI0024959C21